MFLVSFFPFLFPYMTPYGILLGTDHLTCRGGYGFSFRSEFFFRTTRELEYLFFLSHEVHIFFPEFNIRLYDKNIKSVILNTLFTPNSPLQYSSAVILNRLFIPNSPLHYSSAVILNRLFIPNNK
jgi:hypothetical protein